MLRLRLLTAAVAIPFLLVLVLWWPHWSLALFVGVIAVLGVLEYMDMALPDRPVERWFYVLVGALAVTAWSVRGLGYLGPPVVDQEATGGAIAFVLVSGLIWVLLARSDFEAGLLDLGRAVVGILYAGFLMMHFTWLHLLPDGPRWVIFVIMTGMAGDSAGYFVGHAIGKHKLIPRVSPGKTVEGAAGIVLGNVVAGVLAKALLLPSLSWTEVMLLAVLQGTLGQIGDLCESVMKRTYGIKDSGRLFPGHGGVLDRIDSLVFPVAGMYYYVALCR